MSFTSTPFIVYDALFCSIDSFSKIERTIVPSFFTITNVANAVAATIAGRGTPTDSKGGIAFPQVSGQAFPEMANR